MTQLHDRPQTTRRRTRVRDFMYHLVVFVFVSTMLIGLDLMVEAGSRAMFGLDWAYWVVGTWGLGVAAHAVDTWFAD